MYIFDASGESSPGHVPNKAVSRNRRRGARGGTGWPLQDRGNDVRERGGEEERSKQVAVSLEICTPRRGVRAAL